MLYTLRFFFSSKCSLFHNANLFGSCIIHILYTGCAEIKKKNNSGAKGLNQEKKFYRNLCTNLHFFLFRSGFDPLTLLAGLAFLAFLLQTLHALLYRQTTSVSSVGLSRTISDSLSDIEHTVKAALDKYVSNLNIFTMPMQN